MLKPGSSPTREAGRGRGWREQPPGRSGVRVFHLEEVSMELACPDVRWRRSAVTLLVCAALGTGTIRPAHAYMDRNANKIDDVIEEVNLDGWAAAFEHQDPAQ